jgi:hypothetical protein
MMRLTVSFTLAFFVACLAREASSRAETFVLAGGGRIEGKLLNPDDSPRELYLIETAEGRISLAADQVESVDVLSPVMQQYQALLPRMPSTADGQWKMAEWCRASGLEAQREQHLEELLKLDPDHADARHALGYNKVDGKWVRPDEHMRSLGYIRFEGAWRLPQDVESRQRKERLEEAQNQWRSKLRNLRSQFGKRRQAEATAELQAIRDPFAAPALADLLHDEESPAVAAMYVEVLGRLNHPAATSALVREALENNDERVRDLCLDQLARRGEHGAVPVFVNGLGHKDNYMVQRAAIALARMGDQRAVVPLIDALTTKHKVLVNPGGGSPGGIGATFSPNGGGGGLSMGGKPKIVEREVENPAVLQALTAMTGAHHGYDKATWKAWYTAQNTPLDVNLRREP